MTLGELKMLLFEAPEIHLLLWLGLVSVGLIGWIFTGKFIFGYGSVHCQNRRTETELS